MTADEEQPDVPGQTPKGDAAGQDADEVAQSAGEESKEPKLAQEADEPKLAQEADEPKLAAEADEPALAKGSKEPTLAQEAQEPMVATEAQDPTLATEAQDPTLEKDAAEPALAEGSEEHAQAEGSDAAAIEEDEAEEPAPRVKPAVPGAHLEVDIVPEGADPLGRGEEYVDPYAIDDEEAPLVGEGEEDDEREALTEPIATAAIDLAAGARYRATGKRKTAIARVTLRPGSGSYLINGRALEEHFPRTTLQRNIRQPLETVGYQERMDVVARLHGGGISAQAGALRHGVSRALLEADPNLRGELKRRGFLTRDSRAKERKKAGLKKARKRPQFSKR
jgi:small subunit ribosomal protein S9